METPEIQITTTEAPMVQPNKILPAQTEDVEMTETAIVQNPIPEDTDGRKNSENNTTVGLVLDNEVPSEDTQLNEVLENDTETSLQEKEEKITPEEKLVKAMDEFGEKVDGLKEAIREFTHTVEEKPKNFEGFNEFFTMLLMRLKILKEEYERKKIEKGEDHPEAQALKQRIDTLQYMIGMVIGFIMGQALER